MARGQAAQQLATTNAIGGGQLTQANTLEQQLIPAYTSMMNTGYTSPAEEGAASVNEMGSATAPYGTAQFTAANRAAATNNPADLSAQQDKLALQEGTAANDAAAKLQEEKMQGQMYGMTGLGEEQAGNEKMAESMYGLGPSTLQAGRPQGFNVGLGPFKFGVGS